MIAAHDISHGDQERTKPIARLQCIAVVDIDTSATLIVRTHRPGGVRYIAVDEKHPYQAPTHAPPGVSFKDCQ